MRCGRLVLLLFSCLVVPLHAQSGSEGPASEKAKKSYKQALEYLDQENMLAALDSLKKADKQDGGHCLACQNKIIKYAVEIGEWKAAETAAEELITEAQPGRDTAVANYQLGVILMREALQKHKDEIFSRAHDAMTKAQAADPSFAQAVYVDGQVLAHLKQDDAAKAEFEKYVKLQPESDPLRQRALRYISQPDLARARMAPAFAVTTLEGQRISLDDLKGKVVLLDFWATWCGPCREALPHMRQIAKKFQGEPLVVLSVSLDDDEQQWKEFVEKNDMPWMHYRDGNFDGPVAKLFNVDAIPHTFTIDADGILQDEHIGDASIEGKLKKLIARARELQSPAKTAQSAP